MQRFQMRTRYLKVGDTGICIQFFKNRPRGILDKFNVGPVQLGEGLLVLSLDHHLCFGLQPIYAVPLNLF